MAILTSNDYPAIRAALDVQLDADDLSDDVIAMDIYIGAAELWIADRDSLSATRTGNELTHIRAATIYYTASLLAPALPRLASESLEDAQVQWQKQDWAQLASELQQRAETHLQAVLDASEDAPLRPTMFARVSGIRGK